MMKAFMLAVLAAIPALPDGGRVKPDGRIYTWTIQGCVKVSCTESGCVYDRSACPPPQAPKVKIPPGAKCTLPNGGSC
jgi:hypothetical protein